LSSTGRRKRLGNRNKNRDFCFFRDALSRAPTFLDWRDAEGSGGVTVAALCERRIK
jgi:hypothetical protein